MIRLRERLCYAAGDLGFNFVWQSIELYLLFFYVRGLGLSPATASGIFLAGAVADWLADPLVGAMADRYAPRVPLRAWVAAGGPAAAMLLVLAFAHPSLPPAMLALFALATHLMLRLAYSVGNIPYATLTARMSAEPADHLALTGIRMQGAAVGGLIAAAIYALNPARNAVGADFRTGAIVLALLSLPAFLATLLGVRERVLPPVARQGLGGNFAEMAALMIRSAPLRRLLVTILLAGLSVTVIDKSLLFLFEELGALRLGYFVALIPGLALLLSVPVWLWIAGRVGCSRALLAAALLNAAVCTLALLASGAVPVMVLITLAIISGAGMSIMFWTLVPAVVAGCERDAASGGCAGRVYALAAIARKLAQALGPQVVALTLISKSVSVLWGIEGAALLALAALLLYRPTDSGEPAPHHQVA